MPELLTARRVALLGGVYANYLALEAALGDARDRSARAGGRAASSPCRSRSGRAVAIEVVLLRISIIVPILNEEDELPAFLDALSTLEAGDEVVFVDGGSRDRGPGLVRQAGHPLCESPPGRARQMNTGARRAAGDVLLFLHADTRLPPDGVEAVRAAMRDPAVVAGRFDLVYENVPWPYPWIAWSGNLRSRLTGICTGDQTIFVRRAAFEAVGGYPDIPLMEDVELSRRLKRLGRVACLRARAVGSTRKYRQEGVWRTVALMALLRALYALGVRPERLHRLYYRRDPGKQLHSSRG